MQGALCLRVALRSVFPKPGNLQGSSFEIGAEVNYILVNIVLKEYSFLNVFRSHETIALHCDSLISQTIWLQLKDKTFDTLFCKRT